MQPIENCTLQRKLAVTGYKINTKDTVSGFANAAAQADEIPDQRMGSFRMDANESVI